MVNDKGERNKVKEYRDKMRKVARNTRGFWSFNFYEMLQNLNKESIKRDLNPATK